MADFWQASPDGDGRFHYKAPPIACVGPPGQAFFMGGAGMAAHIDALERHFDKPLLWATTQFLSHGLLDDEMHLTVEQLSGGRSIVQAQSDMRRGDTLLHRTIAALGAREPAAERAFVTMPDVATPLACGEKEPDAYGDKDNLIGQFERRTAHEDAETGREYMWLRPLFDVEISAAFLALVSDFFLGAHELTRRGTSLDNTFRLCALRQSTWLLTVTQLSGFTRGSVHGTQHIFAEDGTLLSTSSQTGLLPRPL